MGGSARGQEEGEVGMGEAVFFSRMLFCLPQPTFVCNTYI
jgi:hypothetical protein